jgi:DNA-binding NarL/FixJ family response regulator
VTPIRVLLADDQALLRAGFRVLIDAVPDLDVVGEASDGEEAVRLARETRADVVLMDIRMPGTDGLAATRAITSDDELAGVKVIVLTTFELDEYVVQAIDAGASGFLGKGVAPDELTNAIRVVAAGDALLSPKATAALIAMARGGRSGPGVDGIGETGAPDAAPDADSGRALDLLTPREREIVGLVARGLSNDEIAERLYLSPLTVKTHANRAMMKVGARDRAQLVVLAYRAGLVPPGG